MPVCQSARWSDNNSIVEKTPRLRMVPHADARYIIRLRYRTRRYVRLSEAASLMIPIMMAISIVMMIE